MEESDYFKTRKVAVMLTIIVLVLGAFVYFATDVVKKSEMTPAPTFEKNPAVNQSAVVNDSNPRTALV